MHIKYTIILCLAASVLQWLIIKKMTSLTHIECLDEIERNRAAILADFKELETSINSQMLETQSAVSNIEKLDPYIMELENELAQNTRNIKSLLAGQDIITDQTAARDEYIDQLKEKIFSNEAQLKDLEARVGN